MNGSRAGGDVVLRICREACVEGQGRWLGRHACRRKGIDIGRPQLAGPVCPLVSVMLRAERPRVSSQEEVLSLIPRCVVSFSLLHPSSEAG